MIPPVETSRRRLHVIYLYNACTYHYPPEEKVRRKSLLPPPPPPPPLPLPRCPLDIPPCCSSHLCEILPVHLSRQELSSAMGEGGGTTEAEATGPAHPTAAGTDRVRWQADEEAGQAARPALRHGGGLLDPSPSAALIRMLPSIPLLPCRSSIGPCKSPCPRQVLAARQQLRQPSRSWPRNVDWLFSMRSRHAVMATCETWMLIPGGPQDRSILTTTIAKRSLTRRRRVLLPQV